MAKFGSSEIGLRAPGILSFMFSVILTVITLVCYFFGANIPYLESLNSQFWALVIAQTLLVLGCLFRFGS